MRCGVQCAGSGGTQGRNVLGAGTERGLHPADRFAQRVELLRLAATAFQCLQHQLPAAVLRHGTHHRRVVRGARDRVDLPAQVPTQPERTAARARAVHGGDHPLQRIAQHAVQLERGLELRAEGKLLEAQRLIGRTKYDLEMIQETGYCGGIENYSRFFDGRARGQRAWTLMDYFRRVPGHTENDWLVVVDESHVTLPQIRGMYFGDKARKQTLVDHGFRLPSAMDNHPLRFEEFEEIIPAVVYVSATPSSLELERSHGVIAEQVIRPTGLVDPIITLLPARGQIPDLLERCKERAARGERVLVTALTKRLCEELTNYLHKNGVRVRYLHSEIETLDRIEILKELREGLFDVLVGVNLLREGLDLPEVSLVCILDADTQGFLRSR